MVNAKIPQSAARRLVGAELKWNIVKLFNLANLGKYQYFLDRPRYVDSIVHLI
jgi:hypothetical protein